MNVNTQNSAVKFWIKTGSQLRDSQNKMLKGQYKIQFKDRRITNFMHTLLSFLQNQLFWSWYSILFLLKKSGSNIHWNWHMIDISNWLLNLWAAVWFTGTDWGCYACWLLQKVWCIGDCVWKILRDSLGVLVDNSIPFSE